MELNFDLRGNLQPYEKVKLSLEEFKGFFVDQFSGNSQREQVFDSYLNFVHDFSAQVSTQFTHRVAGRWIDGSFVTTKEYPNDIDFVTFINHELFEAKEKLIHENLRLEGAKKKYAVDAYTLRQYPEEHAKYMLYRSDWVYWYHWFSQTKKNRAKKKYPKGFIEIEFNGLIYGSDR